MRSLIRFFAARRAPANVFTFLIIVLGLGTLSVIQRDNFPKVEFGLMTVITRYLGASPEDVELNITNKIEESLKQVDGLKKVISYSMENISYLQLTLDPDAGEMSKTRELVRDAIGKISDFPKELDERPVIRTATTDNTFPVIEVGITGTAPYQTLRETARLVERELLKVPGVASVTKYGYLDREIKVEIMPDAVEKWQISSTQIAEAIQKRNIRATGGSFESFTSDKNIVTLAQFQDPREVEDVIVHTFEDGTFVRVRDLARVREDFEPEKVLTRMNGNSALSFLVYKKEAADLIRTADAIKRFVEDKRLHLPENVNIEYSNDASRLVHNRLNVVLSNGAMGLVLVLIVLTLFLDIRSAFWVAMGIPVTLLGTLFFLPMFGVYLDSIVLATMILMIGIVVDDGIIVTESIWRKREHGAAPLKAAVEGLYLVIGPVATTILTTILAFVPMFFIPGMLGSFVFVIPLVVILTLTVSFAETFIALPAHLTSSAAKSMVKQDDENRLFSALQSAFGRFLHRVLPWRYGVITLFIAILIGAFWYAGRYMDFVLFPSHSADAFKIFLELPSGSSLQATSAKAQEIEKLVEQLPEGELDSYVTRIGNHGKLGPGENENWAYLGIYLTPYSTRERNADQIVEELRAKVSEVEGISKVWFQIESGGPPVGPPIELRIVSSDDTLREQLATLVVQRLEAIEGVKDIDRDDKRGKEQIKIALDFIRLAEAGLTVADVARNVRLAYDGESVTSVRYGGEDVDFRVILTAESRSSLYNLAELPIPTPTQRFIRLGEIATLHPEPGLARIFHFDHERAITVTADVEKGVITPLKAIDLALADIDLPREWPGTRISIGGEAEESTASIRHLMIAFAASGIAIYLLLYLLFQSLLQPLLVLLAIPFGLVGVILAFALHHEPLGFLAMLGVVGLTGIVVNDSLILVDLVNRYRRKKPDAPLKVLLVVGAKVRFRPIMLTTITTVAGLLPLAYGLGGSDPFSAPMALALGYGLLFATALTLVLLPCLIMVEADLKAITEYLLPKKQRRI